MVNAIYSLKKCFVSESNYHKNKIWKIYEEYGRKLYFIEVLLAIWPQMTRLKLFIHIFHRTERTTREEMWNLVLTSKISLFHLNGNKISTVDINISGSVCNLFHF